MFPSNSTFLTILWISILTLQCIFSLLNRLCEHGICIQTISYEETKGTFKCDDSLLSDKGFKPSIFPCLVDRRWLHTRLLCEWKWAYRDVLSLSALAYAALCLKSMLHMKSFSYLSGLCTSFGNVKDGVGWYVQRNAKTMRWTCKLMHTRWTFFKMVKESES